MVDLDEGERRMKAAEGHGLGAGSSMRWCVWLDDNARALLSELRAARATIAAQQETIAKLEGLLMAHDVEEGP